MRLRKYLLYFPLTLDQEDYNFLFHKRDQLVSLTPLLPVVFVYPLRRLLEVFPELVRDGEHQVLDVHGIEEIRFKSRVR